MRMVEHFTLITSTTGRNGSDRHPPSLRGRGQHRWIGNGGGRWPTPWLVGTLHWRLVFQWPIMLHFNTEPTVSPAPAPTPAVISSRHHSSHSHPLSGLHTVTSLSHTHAITPSLVPLSALYTVTSLSLTLAVTPSHPH